MSRQESEKFIEEARLLLPWYLTNTLSDEEQDLVNRALEASPELRKEFVREEKMMRLVKENTSLLELSALDTTEQRLENTLARIEREGQSSETAIVASDTPLGFAAAKTEGSWLSRLFKQKLFDIDWLTPANAVFASLLAVNVGVLGYHQLNKEEVMFDVAAVPESSGESLKQQFLMEFRSDAPYVEVCDFLHQWDARIISGPSNRNVFTVEMASPAHTDAMALADKIMAKASNDNAPVVFIGPKVKFED